MSQKRLEKMGKYEKVEFGNIILKNIDKQSFWSAERILFLANLVVFLGCALVLLITEKGNSANGNFNTFWDYLFNSISVGTLTGLFRGDSGNYTFWGQFALLVNMVISGIVAGIVSVILLLFVRSGLNRNKSLENEVEKIGLNSFGIINFILIDLGIIWILGIVLFLFFGKDSLWQAIFDSASHIFNDGITAKTNSMIPFRNNLGMLISGGFLITVGGFGIAIRAIFYKWFLGLVGLKNIAKKIPESLIAPRNFAALIVGVSLFLQIGGGFMIHYFEKGNPLTFAGDGYTSEVTKSANAWYMSVSSRTAGFNTFALKNESGEFVSDMSVMNDKTSYVLILLMTVGASSGSFAGGVLKLTAFIYLFVYLYSRFRGRKEVMISGDFAHFSEKTVFEANFRIIGFISMIVLITLGLFISDSDISGYYLLFESISAVSNTGLSLGATPLLSQTGMGLLMILMTVGKIGFISFIISFFPNLQKLLDQSGREANEFPVD